MTESTRQFYGSIALLLIFIAGVFGGAVWGRPWDNATTAGSLLVVLGVLFGWAATHE